MGATKNGNCNPNFLFFLNKPGSVVVDEIGVRLNFTVQFKKRIELIQIGVSEFKIIQHIYEAEIL